MKKLKKVSKALHFSNVKALIFVLIAIISFIYISVIKTGKTKAIYTWQGAECTVSASGFNLYDSHTIDGRPESEVDLVLDGVTIFVQGNHTFKSLKIINNGLLTHPAILPADYEIYV
jgi:hypothetical protein